MAKQTIDDLDLRGKRVLIRVDFNVPRAEGEIEDDTRIVAALPTIRKCIAAGAKVILMSHLDRPKGKVVESMRLTPAAERLSELLGQPVAMAPDCIGPKVKAMVDKLEAGDVLMLENLRFHPEEEANDPEFSRQLAAWGDVYIDDAFGTSHRAHASTAGVPALLPGGAGYLLQKEIAYLGGALADPKRPFVAILGGAKVAEKIGVITNLLPKVDVLIVGGAMAYTFLKAQGVAVGISRVEDDRIEDAKRMLDAAEQRGVPFLLPVDHVVGDKFPLDDDGQPIPDVTREEIPGVEIPADRMGLDIGEKTVEEFCAAIRNAGTIVWNGPMGVFEDPRFAEGTRDVGEAVAGPVTILGGGDTVRAANTFGLEDRVTHISTGGGASLEFLEGRELPGIAALKDK